MLLFIRFIIGKHFLIYIATPWEKEWKIKILNLHNIKLPKTKTKNSDHSWLIYWINNELIEITIYHHEYCRIRPKASTSFILPLEEEILDEELESLEEELLLLFLPWASSFTWGGNTYFTIAPIYVMIKMANSSIVWRSVKAYLNFPAMSV